MGLLAEGEDRPPAQFLKGSGLNDRSLTGGGYYGFARDFPHLFAT